MILIIDCGSKKTKYIAEKIKEYGAEHRIISADNIKDSDIVGISGVIISGSPALLSKINSTSYLEKFSFIKDLKIPILGICFGHQILGMIFGGRVWLDKECREPVSIKLVLKNHIFKGLPNNPIFKEDHTESVSLPENFEHLATSEFCEVEAMKHKERPIYGVQFHPEVSGENGNILLNNFLGMC